LARKQKHTPNFYFIVNWFTVQGLQSSEISKIAVSQTQWFTAALHALRQI